MSWSARWIIHTKDYMAKISHCAPIGPETCVIKQPKPGLSLELSLRCSPSVPKPNPTEAKPKRKLGLSLSLTRFQLPSHICDGGAVGNSYRNESTPPFHTTYEASDFVSCYRMDLEGSGVKVVTVTPGFFTTNIITEIDNLVDKTSSNGTKKGPSSQEGNICF